MAARSGLTISRDITLNSLTVTKLFVSPVVPNLSGVTSTSIGSLVYNKSTGGLSILGTTGWVPVDAQTSNLSLVQGATGESIVASGTGPNITVKGISVTGTLSVIDSGTELVLSTPSSTYVAGTDITIASGIISNATPQIQYTASGGLSLAGTVFSNTGVLSLTANPNNTIAVGGTLADPVLTANYQAGTNITIVGNTISNAAGPPNVLSLTAANTTLVVNNTTPTNPIVTGNYVGGNAIQIAGNVISNNAVSTITAGNSTIVIGGSATVPSVSCNYTAGTNISIVGNTISLNVVAVTLVSAADNTVVIGGTATAPTVAGNLQAGTNITISGGNTINKVPFILDITAADTTVVIGGTPTAKTIQGNYVAGTGISIVGNSISYNPGVDTVVAADNTAIVGGTSSNPTVRLNYQAGTNITIVGNTISQTGVPVLSDIVSFPAIISMTGVVQRYNYTEWIGATAGVGVPSIFPGMGSYCPFPYYVDGMSVTCYDPRRNSGLSVTIRLFVNGAFTPENNTQTVTLTDDVIVATASGTGFYVPAGSLVTAVIDNQPAKQTVISFRRTFITTSALAAPPAPTVVTVVVGTGLATFTVSIPGSPANVNVCGIRLSILAGVTPPVSWSAPADAKVNELGFIGSNQTTVQLQTTTQYSYSVWLINGNTPATMGPPFSGTFTTL